MIYDTRCLLPGQYWRIDVDDSHCAITWRRCDGWMSLARWRRLSRHACQTADVSDNGKAARLRTWTPYIARCYLIRGMINDHPPLRPYYRDNWGIVYVKFCLATRLDKLTTNVPPQMRYRRTSSGILCSKVSSLFSRQQQRATLLC